jgi:hypothetical protein
MNLIPPLVEIGAALLVAGLLINRQAEAETMEPEPIPVPVRDRR